MSTRVALHTLGCRLNQAETAALARGFAGAGYEVVDEPAAADVVVVNTCTVTEHGDADARKLVSRIARANPAARIALIGCQAQLQASALAALPNVNWVVGNAEKMNLPSIVTAEPEPLAPHIVAGPIGRAPFTLPQAAVDDRHTRANLKIQDGCDFYCLFCTIPYARGRARSRVFSDLLGEARTLLGAGHRELILTGVNLGTYQHEGQDFLAVVRALLALPGLDRLRISSIEPTTIPAALLDLLAEGTPLCRYLHVPLQSGSDFVLRKMNRRYTAAEYADFIRAAAARTPFLGLGTDVLVGYPVETETHFDETYALLESLPFTYFHVFSYSQREHAKSHLLGPPLPPPVVARRNRALRQLSERCRQRFHQRLLGREELVLFEQSKDGLWSGLTDHYVRVQVAAPDRDLHNHLLPVRLVADDGPAMRGELR